MAGRNAARHNANAAPTESHQNAVGDSLKRPDGQVRKHTPQQAGAQKASRHRGRGRLSRDLPQAGKHQVVVDVDDRAGTQVRSPVGEALHARAITVLVAEHVAIDHLTQSEGAVARLRQR